MLTHRQANRGPLLHLHVLLQFKQPDTLLSKAMNATMAIGSVMNVVMTCLISFRDAAYVISMLVPDAGITDCRAVDSLNHFRLKVLENLRIACSGEGEVICVLQMLLAEMMDLRYIHIASVWNAVKLLETGDCH